MIFAFLLLLAVCAGQQAAAQGSGAGVSGKLLDSAGKEGLKGATIVLKDGADSTHWRYVISKDGGAFYVGALSPGRHSLNISFQGYEPKTVSFSVSGSKPVSLGSIYLPISSSLLGAVVVTAHASVRVQKDTLDYNPALFHTRPNADLGDVIEKMPGMDVDKNGNVTAQGEKVQRVLVNGKRFFSNDPTLAIKNVPPEMISRIEVFDDLSDQSKFTGIDDGQRVKTMNIITKKNINRGDFGKVVAGGGDSKERGLYQESIGLHHFNGDRMISVVGQANNTNGLTTTTSGGLNYSDLWGKGKTKAYGSYHLSHTETESGLKSNTQSILPGDSSIFAHREQTGKNGNTNHGLDFNTETTFNAFNSLTARTNMSWQGNTSESGSTTATTKGDGSNLNNSAGSASNTNHNYAGTVDVLFGHRFSKPMRSFSVALNAGLNSGDGKTYNKFLNHYYHVSVPDSAVTVDQYFHAPGNNKSVSLTASYIEPLSKREALEFNYNYFGNHAESGRYGYNYDIAAHSYSQVDTTLTNLFSNDFSSHRLSLTYRYNSQLLNFNAGMGVQEGSKTGHNLSKSTTVGLKYTSLYPTVNFTYNINTTAHLGFNYDGRNNQPALADLQPITDNSDPLHVRVGNPNLRQSFAHNFRLLYNSFNRQNMHNFFIAINASILDNNIVSSVITNTSTGADTTTLVNLSGGYNANATINYGFQLKDPRSNINFSTTVSDNHTVGYVNGLLNPATNYSFGETVKWTTNLKQHIDMNLSATPTYYLAIYGAEPGQNNHYFSQTITADGAYFTKSGWMAGSDVNYTSYSGRAAGFNTTTMVWNGYFAKELFSRQQGELRLSVHDLLNQSSSISRTVSPTMIQDTENRVLTRFFLLTFTYHIRHFTGRPPKTDTNGEG